MKILLAGGVHEAAALLQALEHAGDHEITHCANGTRAIIEMLGNGYDWAIIRGHAISGCDTRITRLIGMMDKAEGGSGVLVPAGGSASEPSKHASCGVEWSKDGVLLLHCGLHTLLQDSTDLRQSNPAIAGDILFEYHAPCCKGRRRNG